MMYCGKTSLGSERNYYHLNVSLSLVLLLLVSHTNKRGIDVNPRGPGLIISWACQREVKGSRASGQEAADKLSRGKRTAQRSPHFLAASAVTPKRVASICSPLP